MKTRIKLYRLNNICKEIKKFIEQTIKNYQSMKKRISKIMLIAIITLCMVACSSMHVGLDRVAEGTQTTITITTNNPITTDVQPNLNQK